MKEDSKGRAVAVVALAALLVLGGAWALWPDDRTPTTAPEGRTATADMDPLILENAPADSANEPAPETSESPASPATRGPTPPSVSNDTITIRGCAEYEAAACGCADEGLRGSLCETARGRIPRWMAVDYRDAIARCRRAAEEVRARCAATGGPSAASPTTLRP